MLNPKIKQGKSKIQGTGLFATGFIKKGSVVWRLDKNEKRLSLEELKRLPKALQKYAFQYKDKYIVATDKSEVLNHSCDPNTWWEDDETLTASRNILPGQEITYDYSTSDVTEESMPPMRCNCGSENCRGIITSKDCLNKVFQKRYRGHLPSWVEVFIRKHSEN